MIKLLTIIVPVWNQSELVVRALDSIPRRSDIKIIIVDDGSTDNSFQVVSQWQQAHQDVFDILVLHNTKNLGVGMSKRRAYALADSEFIYVLDSDDYLLTNNFNDLLDRLDFYRDYDIIRIDNELNDGRREHDSHTAGWSYLLRNRFKIDYPKVRKAEDWLYWVELQKAGARMVSTGLLCYHYNSPREGSLVWNYKHGLIDWKGDQV